MKNLIRAFATFAAIEDERKHAEAVLASPPQTQPADVQNRARAAETIKALDGALEVLASASGRTVAQAFLEWNRSGRARFDPRQPKITHLAQETSSANRSRRPGHIRG